MTREESIQRKRARMEKILRRLRLEFPDPSCALQHRNPLQLLVATILSAQCTDERVNKVTPELFRLYRTAEEFAAADTREIENIIRSTGFFRAKAKNIIACCRAIVDIHGGEVPGTMKELVRLPGVGRKTANVVLGNAFGIPGFAVDTHVIRITNLLKLTRSENPEQIEKDLTSIMPAEEWTDASHMIILHGRKTCIARRPKCEPCVIRRYCPSSRHEAVHR